MSEQKVLTDALAKSDIASTMRTTLQQYGIPATEPMTVSLKVGEKEVTTTKLAGLSSAVETTSSDKSIETAVKEVFSQVDEIDGLMEKMETKNGRTPVTVTFKHGENLDNEVVLAIDWCCPCPNNPGKPCCWC
ncbi:MAG: hypothetical protein QNJ60_17955 [Xenococcaceae cyanobacterium MO_188.B19]|nr:hypothetical protein [Xenococcaceae cyanobacterium MO_188.B19]